MPLTTTSVANGPPVPNRVRELCDLILTLMTVGGLLFFWTLPWWILLIPALALWSRTRLVSGRSGRSSAAIMLISSTVLFAIAAAVERTTVELCFLIASFNSLELLRARSTLALDDLMSGLNRGLLNIWCTIAVVSGALWPLSYSLRHIPPESLLHWADKLESADKFLETAGKLSTALLVSLIVFNFVAWRWSAVHTGYARTWRGIIFSRRALESASLVLACVMAFSFIAGRSSNGMIEQLTKARANALSDGYMDVIWTVELAIRKHAILQIANAAFEASPPSAKAAIAGENALPARPRAEGFAWAARNSPARAERDIPDDISPPSGFSRPELESIRAEAKDLDRSEHRPDWLNETGWEALEEAVKLGVSPDRISVLKVIGEQMPLTGKLLDVAFDALDESVMSKIRHFVVETVGRRLNGEPANLTDEVKSAADMIRQSAVSHSAKKQLSDHDLEAFRRELLTVIANETRKPTNAAAFFAKLARTGDANDLRMLFGTVGYAPCLEDSHPGERDK